MDGSEEPVMVFNIPMDPDGQMDSEMSSLFSKTNNVAPELLTLWDSELFMDVHLICTGNKIIKAHRVVLAALSPVFRQIFLEVGPFTEDDCTIVLPEVDSEVIQSFFHHVYSGHSAPVFIDPSISHLKLNELVKTAVTKDASKDLLKATIKSEPDLLASSVDKELLLGANLYIKIL